MSDTTPDGSFMVPASYRACRALIIGIFLAILIFVGLGAVGRGPIRALNQPASTGIIWAKTAMGIGPVPVQPVQKKPPVKPLTKKVVKKKKAVKRPVKKVAKKRPAKTPTKK